MQNKFFKCALESVYDSTIPVLTERLNNLPKATQQVHFGAERLKPVLPDSQAGTFPRLLLGRLKRQNRKTPRDPT